MLMCGAGSPYTYGVFVALYTALLTFPGNFRFLSVRRTNLSGRLKQAKRLLTQCCTNSWVPTTP
jgi:hypothetical protein